MTISSRDQDHWCTSQNVQDIIEIPQKGGQRGYDDAIKRATDTIQSWYKSKTGETSLPAPADVPDLVVQATAWYAVSEASFAFGRNFSGQNNGGQQDRVDTAEGKAHKKFNQWNNEREVDSGESHTEGEAIDAKARTGSIVDEF